MPRRAIASQRQRRRLLQQRLLALFFAGWLLFSMPLLRLLLAPGTLWGLPRGPLLLFGAWALLLALLAWLLERGKKPRRDDDDGS
jgi:hypothetical protein